MNIVIGANVKVGVQSYSGGDKVVDVITKGSFSRRGELIRIEYLSMGDMPSGKTAVTINTKYTDRIKITRDGESPLCMDSVNGEGYIEIGYAGCYTIKGEVEGLKIKILSNSPTGSGKLFEALISYYMNSGGVRNKIEQALTVFELEEN